MGVKEGPRLAALLVSAANPTPDQSVRTLPGNRRNLSRTEALSSCRSSVVLSSLLQALRLACRPATADPPPATAYPSVARRGSVICESSVQAKRCAGARIGDSIWGQVESWSYHLQATKKAICWPFQSPLTDSNRRPPPYDG